MIDSKGGLALKIVTNQSFEQDNIKDTIVGYGENFLKVEQQLMESADSPDLIASGQTVPKGRVIWNDNPIANGYVGWVNLREGKHAPTWKPKENYSVGQEIRPLNDNGNVYQCVTEGRSMMKEPTFLTSNGAEFYDANGNSWFPNYNYQVNDVVFAVNGSKLFYYICETAGLTDITEPVWSATPKGSTLLDGSVVWRKESTVKWKQVALSSHFRPFGKIE